MRRAGIPGVLIKTIRTFADEVARPFLAILLVTDTAGEGHSGQNHSARVVAIVDEVIE
jgi:hypothetical protein